MLQTPRTMFSDEPSMFAVCRDLDTLRQGQILTDLEILTKNGPPIHVHRVIMMARFPGLKKLLMGAKVVASRKLTLHRFPYKVVETVVNYAYTGHIEIDMAMIGHLYLLASTFKCEQVRQWTTEVMTKSLTIESLQTAWRLARTTSNKRLLKACRSIILSHPEYVILMEIFTVDMSATEVIDLLKQPTYLRLDEKKKVKAIFEWIESGGTENNTRIKSFEELLNAVDLTKLSQDEVLEIMSLDCIVVANSKSRQIFANAVKRAKPKECRALTNIYVIGRSLDNRQIISSLPSSQQEQTTLIRDIPFRQGCRYTSFQGGIYITGGGSEDGVETPTVDILVAATGQVVQSTPLLEARRNHAATASTSALFVLGGYKNDCRLDNCEIYTMQTNSWHSLPPMPMPTSSCEAVCVNQDEVLVVGGFVGPSASNRVNMLSYLAPGCWKWNPLAPMHVARICPGVSFVDGCVVVAGGCRQANPVELLSLPSQRGSGGGQWTIISQSDGLPGEGYLASLSGCLHAVYRTGHWKEFSRTDGENGQPTWKDRGALRKFKCIDAVITASW